MIGSLGIQNFKCFEKQTFEFGPLTMLSGLNGMGKSSVLQSLLLLRQSYQQGLLQTEGITLNGDLVQLGTARDVLYEGATLEEFGFDLEFEDGTSASWRFNYDSNADVVSLVSPKAPQIIYEHNLFQDAFHYLQAERIGPRTTFSMSDYLVRQRQQLGPKGEYTSHFLHLFGNKEINNQLCSHPKAASLLLKSQVEAWMSEISPGVRLELTPYSELDLVNLRYSFKQAGQISNSYRSTNVGFGITYTLPILVALLSSNPNDLVLLENPEAHLHPKGQARLGELIARAASGGIQVVVETHSDHLLNGVRIAVHHGLLTPNGVRLYFLDRQEESDSLASRVISPRINRNGRIDHWPEGFFDEWDKSLEQLLRPAPRA